MPEPLLTEFAPAERATRERVLAQSHHFTDGLVLRHLLDYVPDMVMILNADRQIVYANRTVLQAAKVPDLDGIVGLRPGELFHCKHSTENPAGCGTTQFCGCCGAVSAILRAQAGEFSVEECRMTVVTRHGEEALDLRVWASPMRSGNERFTFFVVVDIADEKRRVWLEKIFLHDVMNSATALRGFSWLLESGDSTQGTIDELVRKIGLLSNRLIDEIESHRQLVAAETSELQLQLTQFSSRQVLKEVFGAYDSADLLNGRFLRIAPDTEDVPMYSDLILLERVVGNMVKNGLEGSVPGEVVTLGCRREPHGVAFWVHNPTYIPENVRLQVFNRSFSTKGVGRGLGTYSMKLLTEHYLGGQISLTSTEASGTIFTATYPIALQGTD